MAICIDKLMSCEPTRRWPFEDICHLVADSPDELHEFAKKLGVSSEWFEPHSKCPYYNLTGNRREAALKLGATEIDLQNIKDRMGEM